MVRAWYMDNVEGDQRLPHMTDPPEFIDIETLKSRTGCEYFQIAENNFSLMEQIKKERGYTYEDVCDIHKDRLPNYEEKLKNFFTEHIHSDEEIRYISDGSGYFDLRDINDRWVRVECVPGDMLIVPAGIYHRFTLDTKNYIKARRFFVGEPVWTPINRPGADNHEARTNYLNTMKSKA